MVASMDRWLGKVAIVTGASAGIGAAIAAKLVEEGMVVVGLARRLERMEELRKTMLNKKGTFHPVECDVSIESDILRAFEYVNKLGPIHVLINNAGRGANGYLTDKPTDAWQKIFALNVVGLCIATREAVNDMKKNKISGHIIHINSVAGHFVPNCPRMGIYTASKHAVTALAETLRNEINASKLKIRITNLSPGIVETEIFEANGRELPEEVPRLQPEDIADGVIYALSAPSHVNVTQLTIRPVNEEI